MEKKDQHMEPDVVVTPTSPEEEEESWKDQPHYPEIVRVLRNDMTLENQELLDETPCFGWLWKMDGVACEEAPECSLARHCSLAWGMGQTIRAKSARQIVIPAPEPDEVVNPYVEAHKGSIAKESRARPLIDKKRRHRNKYAQSDKYTRAGWVDQERDVDQFVMAFVEAMGNPPKMPLVWNSKNFLEKYGGLGNAVMSAPASFHALYYSGVVVARFWTNTPRKALVDIVPELVAGVNKLSTELPHARRNRPALSEAFPIPQKSWPKLRPCTHRCSVRNVQAASELGKMIRTFFKF